MVDRNKHEGSSPNSAMRSDRYPIEAHKIVISMFGSTSRIHAVYFRYSNTTDNLYILVEPTDALLLFILILARQQVI
jgi:hypothetical protein